MSGTLTKADQISAIQTENGCTFNRSSEIVETLLRIIKRTLVSGEDVLITGLGKFQVRDIKVSAEDEILQYGITSYCR